MYFRQGSFLNPSKARLFLVCILFIAVWINSVDIYASEDKLFYVCLNRAVWDSAAEEEVEPVHYLLVNDILNRSFLEILSSSSVFKAAECSSLVDSEKVRYRLIPEIRVIKISESEKSGFFAESEAEITVIQTDRREEPWYFTLKAIGAGIDKEKALLGSLDILLNQFEYLLVDFEEWNDRFRIIDIYHNAVIINAGSMAGVKKGDYFAFYDYRTEKQAGTIIIEKTDNVISYGRALEGKNRPETGDSVRKINYRGISAAAYTDYVFGSQTSGYAAGLLLTFFRGLYIFHPVLGYEYYNCVTFNSPVELNILYSGLRLVRHIDRFTFVSQAVIGSGFCMLSDNHGWTYRGGSVKGIIEVKLNNGFFLSAGSGYARWFSGDIEKTPDTGGFTAGLGLGIKY